MGANLLHAYKGLITESGSGGGTGIVGPNEWNSGHQLYLDVNPQTGTTYTFVAADDGALVTFNNASAIAVTLPQAVSGVAAIGSALNFNQGWFCCALNFGAGTVTITPTTSTINGGSSLALTTGMGAIIISDGANYAANIFSGFTPTFTAPAAGDSSARAITSAWHGQNYWGGFVNAFRNPGMDISQRHGTSSFNSGRTTTTAYGLDGWIHTVTTTGVSGQSGAAMQQVASQTGIISGKALQITGNATAGSITDVLIKQRIESFMAARFDSQTITVQCKIYNNTGAAFTPTLIANHPTTTADTFSSLTAESANGATLQSCANGAVTTVAYTFTASSSANLGLELGLDFGANPAGATATIQVSDWDVRVTPGVATGLNSNPPPVELRPIGVEYPLNLRYYIDSDTAAIGGNVGFSGNTAASTTYNAYGYFPAVMRAIPSVSASDVVTPNLFNSGGGTLHITTRGYAETRTSTSTGGSGGFFVTGYTASAEL